MSIINYLFLAKNDKEALATATKNLEITYTLDVIYLPGVTSTRLEALYLILGERQQLKELPYPGNGVLYKLPQKFLSQINDLDKKQIKQLAQEWWNKEPLMFKSRVTVKHMDTGLNLIISAIRELKDFERIYFASFQ